MKLLNSEQILLLATLVLLAGCATTSSQGGSVEPPHDWIAQFKDADSKCLKIDGLFANKGEYHVNSVEKAHSAYLSEIVFSRLPGGLLPHSIGLSTDVHFDQLLVTLIGEMNRELRYKVSCQSGWLVLDYSRSGQYLGDGVIEKQYDQVSYFRKGNQGELIVRVLINAKFNSMYIFNSEVEAEGWYRFQPVSSSDD